MMARYRLAPVLAVLLAGCALPSKETPMPPLLTAQAVGLDGPPAPAIAGAWWKAWGDPQFDRLVDEALRGSPTLAEAVARLRGAAARADEAAAGLLPQAAFDAHETRQRFSAHDVAPPGVARHVEWRGATTASLAWEIDFWGRQAALVGQAAAERAAAGVDVDSAALALTGALAAAYLELDHAFALADLAARTEAQRQAILDVTRGRVASGLDTEVEAREAAGAVAQARVARAAADSRAALAVHEIAALSGAGAEAHARILRPRLDPDAALPLPETLPADLLARRPDVIAARQRVAAALSGRAAAQAAFYPNIDLIAFAGTAAFGLNRLFQLSSSEYGGGAAIHLPLFDAGRLDAQYRGAAAQADAAVAEYNADVLRAVQDVADLLSEIAALRRELGDAQQALDDAEAAYRLAEARYRGGLTGYIAMLNAETQLLAARQQRIDLAFAQAGDRVRLVIALGGGFGGEGQAVRSASTEPRR